MIANSMVTCPECGFQKDEVLPTDFCQITYTCNNCGEMLTARPGDCCVFCSYGSVACPAKLRN